MAARVAELARFGLLDGLPSTESPFLYCSSPDDGYVGTVQTIAVLTEPCEAWRGSAAHARRLTTAVRHAVRFMTASNAPARLHSLLEQLNADAYACRRSARDATRSGFGIVCVAQAGSELFVAQAPPGQFVMRQGPDLHAFPRLIGGAELTLLDDNVAPLGYRPRVNPRLLRTQVADGDVVMLASSAVTRRMPRAARELLDASPDELLTAIGATCDRTRLSDGAVGIMRFARS